MSNVAIQGWWKRYEGVPFHTNSIIDEIMNSLMSNLELDIQQSNERGKNTVPTWHVFYKGIRILAVDINKYSLKCRFLKMQYAPLELKKMKGLKAEKSNKSGVYHIILEDSYDAEQVSDVLGKKLQIIDDVISGRNTKLEKPKQDKERLKEQYFEDEVSANVERVQSGLSLVRRQLVIESGRIDILCRDDRNFPLVLELKTGSGSSDAFEQISRYIKEIESDTNLETSGIIVFQNPNTELDKLCIGSKIKTFVWQ